MDDLNQHLVPEPAAAGTNGQQTTFGMAAPSFTQPVELTLAAPSADDMAQARRVHACARLVEIHRAWRRTARRLERRLGRRIARMRAREVREALARRALAEAERASAEVRTSAPPLRGLPDDAWSRALGLESLVATLALCVVADYLVDRGTLQVLLLPMSLTQSLALLIAVVQTAASHQIGRLLRRRHELPDPSEARHERVMMALLVGFVAATVGAMAYLRGLFGGVVLGGIMLGVGAASALVATTAAYLHASTRVDAHRATERRVRRAGRAVARRRHRLGTAVATVAAAARDLQAGAAEVLSRIDVVYAYGVPEGPEPDWIVEARRWSRGEDLPIDGDVR